MYAQDYDEQIMIYWWNDFRSGNFSTWMEDIYPYVKNAQVFKCPSAPKTPGEYAAGIAGNYLASDYVWPAWIPYTFWTWIDGQTGWGGFPYQCTTVHRGCRSGAHISTNTVRAGILQASQPAQSAFIFDGYVATYYPSTQGTNLVFGSANQTGTSFTFTDRRHYRHNEGINIGFSDGHVKWMRGAPFWMDMSARNASNQRVNVNMRVGS
jgi:prepilin-type processing-associated H-X9-DG protein